MGLSNQTGAMVVSTGNKSEMAVGYSTLYGDLAGGFALIKDLYKTKVYENSKPSKPGKISIIDKKRVFISCANDDLELIEVQMENKARMLTSEWIKGARIKTGDIFDW